MLRPISARSQIDGVSFPVASFLAEDFCAAELVFPAQVNDARTVGATYFSRSQNREPLRGQDTPKSKIQAVTGCVEKKRRQRFRDAKNSRRWRCKPRQTH